MRTLMASSGRRWAALIGLLVVVMALAVPISIVAFSGSQTVEIVAVASNAAGASVEIEAEGPDYDSLTGSITYDDGAGAITLPITLSTVTVNFPGGFPVQEIILDASPGPGPGIGVSIAPLFSALPVPHPVIVVVPLAAGGGVTGPPLDVFGPAPGDNVELGIEIELEGVEIEAD